VRSLIKKTIAYLQRRATEDPAAQIRPQCSLRAIGVNEMIALTALDMLQSAGVTKHSPWFVLRRNDATDWER